MSSNKGMNYYKLRYDKQHPKRDLTRLILKMIALIIAVAIVSIISRLQSHAEVILADAPYKETATQITKQANKASEEASEENKRTSEQHEYSGITISDEEYIELCQIVAAESQTQSLEGQKAVVEVIFNRVLSPEYPDSVHGVLSQKGQFATWKMRNASWVAPDAATAAIEHVMSEGRTVLPDTSYLYFSRGKSSFGTDWIKIQDHWFGRGR